MILKRSELLKIKIINIVTNKIYEKFPDINMKCKYLENYKLIKKMMLYAFESLSVIKFVCPEKEGIKFEINLLYYSNYCKTALNDKKYV